MSDKKKIEVKVDSEAHRRLTREHGEGGEDSGEDLARAIRKAGHEPIETEREVIEVRGK